MNHHGKYMPLVTMVVLVILLGAIITPAYSFVIDEVGVIGQAIRLVSSMGLTDASLRQISTAALKGIASSLGDGTRYLSPEEVTLLLQPEKGLIGVRLGIDGDVIVIRDIVPDSPAYHAGLRVGSALIAVDGVQVGYDIDLALQMLRGEPSSSVSVQVLGQSKAVQTVVIQRAQKSKSQMEWEMLGDTAIITIRGFTDQSTEEVRSIIDALLSLGVSKCVIDLRLNSGGDLDIAVEIAALLTGKRHVGYYTDRQGREPLSYEGPMIPRVATLRYAILIGHRTASAAELLVAALADARAALLVGTTTYGKATVQRDYHLHNGGILSLTIGRLHRVSGDSWHAIGLVPVEYVPPSIQPYGLIPHRPMVLGTVGLDVLRLQRWLTESGYHGGIWDGVMGEQTVNAVNRLRHDLGLSQLREFAPQDILTMTEAQRLLWEDVSDPALIRAIQLLGTTSE